jgi:hypothetical protein
MLDQTSCLAPHTGQVHSQPSERTNTAGKQVSNKILLSISDSDYSSLRPHLEYVRLPNHLVLHEAGGKLEFAYFPNRGLISLVVVMKDGKAAEAGIVGNAGPCQRKVPAEKRRLIFGGSYLLIMNAWRRQISARNPWLRPWRSRMVLTP